MAELFNNNSGAEFSEDRKYRYKLWRIWDNKLPLAMCIGLNPSTANEAQNDTTINILRKVLAAHGFGGFYMTNLFGVISSDPDVLLSCDNPVGENDKHLKEVRKKCTAVFFCWGNFHQAVERAKVVVKMFPDAQVFSFNKNGTPLHPRNLIYTGGLKDPKTIVFKPYRQNVASPDGKIRMLAMYQPFCSLMLHGKVETRIVRLGKKPPYPKGRYVLYTTKKKATAQEISDWCGGHQAKRIIEVLEGDDTVTSRGQALVVGDLVAVRIMTEVDEDVCFVQCKGIMDFVDKKGKEYQGQQWCLVFNNIQKIAEPFEVSGKQGVGFLPEEYYSKLK